MTQKELKTIWNSYSEITGYLSGAYRSPYKDIHSKLIIAKLDMWGTLEDCITGEYYLYWNTHDSISERLRGNRLEGST